MVVLVDERMVMVVWMTQRFVEAWKVVVAGFLKALVHHSLR